MTQATLTENYVAAIRAAACFADLNDCLQSAVHALGVEFFLLHHHIDFSFPPDLVIRLTNYPPFWATIAAERRYLRDDPIIAACQSHSAGFFWSELPQKGSLSTGQEEVLAHYRASGLGEGYTVPLRAPGEYESSCSFAVSDNACFPSGIRADLHLLAAFSFEAARRMWRKNLSARGVCPPPKLSGRQLDCVMLAARGKSASVSAQLLGISPFTVRQHIEDAKRRFGVSSTRQLIVHSLFASCVTFADVLAEDEVLPS